MKKTLTTIAIATTLLFVLSCHTGTCGYDNRRETDESSFFLKLNVLENSISTRATIPSAAGEEDVNILHLLFFDATSLMFIDHIEIDGNNRPLDLSMPVRVPLNNTPALNNHTNYRILVVANINTYNITPSVDEWLNSFHGVNFNTAIREQLPLVGTGQIKPRNLLMSAVVEKIAGVEKIETTLIRAVVRIDVEFRSGLTTHELVSASVWNVPRHTSIWNSMYNNFTSVLHSNAFQRTDNVVDNTIRGQLYTFENRQNSISQNDHRTTAVILGIREIGGIPTYHRVNVHLPFSGQNLQRNTVHTITVNQVLGAGADSKDQAYSSDRSQLQVTINNADMDDRGVILVDGDNVLVIPTNRIVFCPDGGVREFTIFTYSPDGSAQLGVSGLVMDAGLLAILSGNSLTVSATPSVDAREGFIDLVFGNISARIEVVQTSALVEYLELNLQLNDISVFPNYLPNNNPILMTTPDHLPDFVQVTASSEWTAQVFNDGFGFHESTDRIINGTPTNNTFRLNAISQNTGDFMRYGFVVVSLVSNPNINQVLVLRQEGADIVRVFAADNLYDQLTNAKTYFGAMGGVRTAAGAGSQTNAFRVTHSASGLSNIALTSGAEHFTVSSTPGSTPYYTLVTITAKGYNPNMNNKLSGRLGLTSPYGGFEAIDIEQGFFNLSLSTNPVAASMAGGNTGAITVTSTETNSVNGVDIATAANWVATNVTTTYNVWGGGTSFPTLNNTTGTNQGTFTVAFPRILLVMLDVSPTATATVTISNTSITATRNVSQTARVLRNLHFRSGGNARAGVFPDAIGTFAWFDEFHTLHGGFTRPTPNPSADNRRWAGFSTVSLTSAWRNWHNDTQTFFGRGSQFTVQSGAHTVDIDVADSTPTSTIQVFGANNHTFPAGTAVAIRDWLEGDIYGRRVLMLNCEFNAASRNDFNRAMQEMGGNYARFVVEQASRVSSNIASARVSTDNNNSIAAARMNDCALHQYLFRDGPFTNANIINTVNMSGYDGAGASSHSAVLTSWPDTFIPIFWHPTHLSSGNRTVLFGIDPVLRIVFVGQACIFGASWTSVGSHGAGLNWTNNDWSAANFAFARNVAAWFVEVAQHGECFTNQFFD